MHDSIDPAAHGEAGGGKHSEVVQDMDEYGVVKRVDRVTTETPQSGYMTEVRKTLDGSVKTTASRNMSSRAPDPTDVGGSVRNELTPGGSWNQMVTEAFPSAVGLIVEQCEQTGLVHTHSETSTDLSKALTGDVPGCSGKDGNSQSPIYSRESRLTDVGSWRNTLTVRTPIPRVYTFDWTDTTKTLRRIVTYDNHLIVFRNYVKVPDEVASWESVSLSVSINEFNLLDGTAHCRRWVSEEEAGAGGSSVDGGMSYSGSKVVEDRDGNNWRVYFDIYRNDAHSLSSGFLADGSEEGYAAASCMDHTSSLPLPLYNRITLGEADNEFVLLRDGNELFRYSAGTAAIVEKAVEDITRNCYIRVGDFIAVELQWNITPLAPELLGVLQ